MRISRIIVATALSIGALSWAGVAHADWPGDCWTFQHQHELTSGDDTVAYQNADQCVDALGGDDIVSFSSGDNTVWGDAGGDRLVGASGEDIIHGNGGNDTLQGWGDADTITGNDGNDTLFDGSNPAGVGDTITGGAGTDFLYHCTGPGSNSDDDHIDRNGPDQVEYVDNGAAYC
jgi:Ca2+-binding RTX toxin-like protein